MIYFITARDIGRVKIGFSENPFVRFSKVQADNPSKLILEATQEGSKEQEKALHERFAPLRVQGEWFQLNPEIQAYIDGLAQLNHFARRESKIAALMAQAGCSYSYAAKMLGGDRPITIPVAISVFRSSGERIGPLEQATDHEIDILEKFCGQYVPTEQKRAA